MSQQLELLSDNPTQWANVTLIAPQILTKEIKPFAILALKELEGNPDSRTKSLMNADKFSAIREIVRYFARLRSAVKESWHQEDVRSFLEGLRFSPECVVELTSLICIDKMYENIPVHLRIKPGVASMQWKIDISLSQPSINAPQKNELVQRNTFVILTFKLTDGQTNTYRLPINKFHELRFIVASALKSMIVLEKRTCMRHC